MKRWDRKRVVVLGIARQGKALARYLANEGAVLVMSDIKPKDQLEDVMDELTEFELSYVLGEHPLELLDGTSALFLSGGVPAQLPIVEEARVREIPVLNDAQLFLEVCPATVIGITGSAGKTTTTTLVYEMVRLGLEPQRTTVWLGGNIGRSLLEDVGQMSKNDVVVMELSSFQLELMTVSPNIAALLNLTPDHLDRHRSMDAYIEAKRQIIAHQGSDGIVVLGYDDERMWGLQEQVEGKTIAFGLTPPPEGDAAYLVKGELILRVGDRDQVICRVEDLALKGAHNTLNMLAAAALSSTVGVPIDAMAQVAKTFSGVPHRLEFVRTVKGADWYNDSIATTPDRASAAVQSFEEPLVLLLGGQDKDLVWENFARQVMEKARVVILFGEAREKLERVFSGMREPDVGPAFHIVQHFEGAFDLAKDLVQPGDVVLLSPGCTSYDEFPNFEARGDQFKQMVRAL